MHKVVRENEIRSMYQEIVDYSWNSSDPIDTPSFDPWEIARREELTEFERKGVLRFGALHSDGSHRQYDLRRCGGPLCCVPRCPGFARRTIDDLPLLK